MQNKSFRLTVISKLSFSSTLDFTSDPLHEMRTVNPVSYYMYTCCPFLISYLPCSKIELPVTKRYKKNIHQITNLFSIHAYQYHVSYFECTFIFQILYFIFHLKWCITYLLLEYSLLAQIYLTIVTTKDKK